jgi:RNA polymerase sigma factor (sigma-70 family)
MTPMTLAAGVEALGRAELAALVTWAVQRAIAWAEATGTPQDDVTSEALHAIHLALRGHDAGGTTASAYIRRRVEGALLDATRTEKRRRRREVLLCDLGEAQSQPIEDDDEVLARAVGVEGFAVGLPDEDVLKAEMRAALHEELERLPSADRRLYARRHRDEATWEEIAAEMGVAVHIARYHDKRIRERLTAAMRARYDEE